MCLGVGKASFVMVFWAMAVLHWHIVPRFEVALSYSMINIRDLRRFLFFSPNLVPNTFKQEWSGLASLSIDDSLMMIVAVLVIETQHNSKKLVLPDSSLSRRASEY